MKTSLSFIIFTCLLCLEISVAQKTAIYDDDDLAYKNAVEFFDNENYAVAQQLFDDFLQQAKSAPAHPGTILRMNAEYYKAVCAKELLNPDAEQLLLAFTENHFESPKTRMVYYHLGNFYYLNKKYKDAIAYFEKVDISDLSDKQAAEYKFQLGYCYFYAKKTEDAKRLFAEVRNLKNQYYFASNYYYGFIAYTQKDYDEALLSFQKAEESPQYAKVIPCYICQIYFAQKRYDKLIDYAAPLAENQKMKNSAEINYLIGQAYYNKKEYDKARPYLDFYTRNAREVRKEDIYQLAYSQYQAKDYKNAIANFQKLTGYKDSIAQNAYYNMADCYMQSDQKKNAVTAFAEAAKTDFDPAIKQTSLLTYGKLCFELGIHKTAITSLEEFISLYPNTIFADEAQEVLTDIFLTTRDYKNALRVIESARIKSPRIRQAHQKVAYYRGVELYNDKQFDQALWSFNTSLDNPIDPAIQALCRYWKGEIYYRKEDYPNAINSLNQFISLAKLAKDLPSEVSPATANYTLGYCYLRQKNYGNALTYFNTAVSLLESSAQAASGRQTVTAAILADAILRSADCSFQLKNYPAAIAAYNKVIDNKYAGMDYAYFQKGILQGLQSQWDEKIQTMQVITTRFPGSLYADDALYETGNTYLVQEKFQPAVASFEKVLSRGKSNYAKKSLLRLGLIYFNTGNKEKSESYYKQVIHEYPKASEARDAMVALRDIYVDKGEPGSYIAFMKTVPEANITASAEDSVTYLAAENRYKKGDFENAQRDFTGYLNKFPDGTNTTEAYFYRAECLFRAKNYNDALKDYEAVSARSRNIFTEKSLAQAAKIAYYNLKDYQKGYEHYQKLLEAAEYKQNINDALKGLMRCGYQLKKYEELVTYCNKILESEQSQVEDKTEAHYYLGKSHWERNNPDNAISEFEKVARETNNEISAESNYNIALIYFNKNNMEKAEASCFKVINQVPSYESWVVKSFILLADIYVKKDDVFQAKATLQSIMDNYQGEAELLRMVKEKLKAITEAEEKAKLAEDSLKRSKMVTDSLEMEIEK